MTILALDSAGKTAGVALWRDGTLLYESYLSTGNTHSETLLALCADALARTDTALQQVSLLAASAGPGSFTGLRIGLSVVKGLALPHGIPCAAIGTLEALAASLCHKGIVACALDARRGEVYCAAFRAAGGTLTRLLPDTAMPAAAFAAQLTKLDEPVLCMGDGAALVVAAAQSPAIAAVATQYTSGRAHGICLLAAQKAAQGDVIDASALTPEYHRLSQAQRERAERLAAQST